MMPLLSSLLIAGLLTAFVAQAQFFVPIPPPPSAAAAASSSQLLLSSTSLGASSSADRWMAVGYTANGLATADFKSMVFPVAGTITSIRARTVTNPASGNWTFTLVKNGSDTALTCQITSASSGLCSGSGSIDIAAGDWASIKIDPGAPSAGSIIATSLIFVPTTANDTLIPAAGTNFSAASQQAAGPFGNAAVSVVANRRLNVLPDGGTLDKFYVVSNAPGASTSYAYEIYKNGVASGIGGSTGNTCIVADANTTCNDAVDSVSVSASDDISFAGTPTNTPAAATAGFGLRYRPTTTGSFALMVTGQVTAEGTTDTVFYPLAGGSGGGTTVEANWQNVSDTMTITKLLVELPSAPGSGKSRTYTLRKNGSDTALTCTIEDATTSCSACASGCEVTGGPITVAANDLLATSAAPSGSPAAVAPQISYLANR